ncbi:MAG: TAXI family TRAP transporter solute-binding subunit [Alphaproteobacteria bacterium]
MKILASITALMAITSSAAIAQTSITYKSAKSTSSYYQMAVQYSEAIKKATQGDYIVTVEESQGSVQNVNEVPRRGANYLFTTPPSLIVKSMKGEEPFRQNEKYNEIRALFPIPSLNMHFVVSQKSGINSLEELSGKKYVIGKGSFSARKTQSVFATLGIEGVKYMDIELNSAIPALKNGQVDGFTTASSWPTPNVIEIAASMPIKLLSPSEEQLKQLGEPIVTIPAGTYKGVDYDVPSITLPVIVYTTSETDEETAYNLTKIFWESQKTMAEQSGWWNAVDIKLLNNAATKLHKGAQRYYKEQGIEVPAKLMDE